MALFAHRFCSSDAITDLDLPGRYDEQRALRLYADGEPVAQRAATDGPHGVSIVGPTSTKAMADRDEAPTAASFLGTKTSAGIDRDDAPSLVGTATRSGLDRDDAAGLLGTITFSGPDRDD